LRIQCVFDAAEAISKNGTVVVVVVVIVIAAAAVVEY